MLGLLVVDDEPIIADSLYTFFSSTEEMELNTYKAYSGNEALEIISKHRVDIVLTDIRMPDVTGIELQSKICRQWPRCKVIFLTGYNDFDYIRTAMRNGAVDYIVKGELNDVILKAVVKAARLLEEEIKAEQFREKVTRSIQEAIPLLRSRYILDLVEGQCPSGEAMAEQFDELGIVVSCKAPVLIMMARVDYWPEGFGFGQQLQVLYGIQKIVDKYLGAYSLSVTAPYGNSRILWLLQSGSDDTKGDALSPEAFLTFIQGTMETMQELCKDFFKLPVSFVVDGTYAQWEELDKRFDLMKSLFNTVAGLRSEVLLVNDGKCNEEPADKAGMRKQQLYNIRMQLKKLDLLGSYINSAQQSEFFGLFDNIVTTVKKSRSIDYNVLREVYYSFVPLFVNYINKWDVGDEIAQRMDLDRLTSLESHASWDDAMQYFRSLAEWIFRKTETDSENDANRIVESIHMYIEQHIGEDITVGKLAEFLHFSPSYLSRLYKQLTNKSLMEKTTEARLSKAKELLRQNGMRIGEIAVAIGFADGAYFSRFFRKHTDITPQEYRDRVGKLL